MDRRLARRLTCLASILVALLALAPAVLAAPQATPTAIQQARIALVAIDDGGKSGTPVGCGDSLVPVTVEVPDATTTEGKITQALTKLFSLRDQFYGQSGLFNALYQSRLSVVGVEMQGTVAAIYLSGTLSVGGVCDEPRVEGQIVETARQVAGVTNAIVIYDGGSLFSPPGSVTFRETGQKLESPFLQYWERNGGLAVFGFPLTNQRVEGGLRVQYFERQRFEHHPENNPPYNVLFGLLGSQDAQRRGLTGMPAFARQSAAGTANCEYFPQTGHNMCFAFRTYWHAHGLDFGEPGFSARESLALFGYPISEEFRLQLEDGKTYTVQYFERARFEYHPENHPPYDVLLGRLGAVR